MTKEEKILQAKDTALNNVRKIYDKHNYEKGVGLSNNSWDESWSIQRDEKVKRIMNNLENILIALK